MKMLKLLSTALIATVLFTGCNDNTDAEEIGENIDEAVTDAGNAVEDACENVKEKLKAEEENC